MKFTSFRTSSQRILLLRFESNRTYLIPEFIYMCKIINHLILSLKQLSI